MLAHEVIYEGIPPLPDTERVLANAIMFLVEGEELEAVKVLLSCSIEIRWSHHFPSEGNLTVEIKGPRSSVDKISTKHRFNKYDEDIYYQIYGAIGMALPAQLRIRDFDVSLEMPEPDPAWRTHVTELVGGKVAHNQNPFSRNDTLIWKSLRFNSEPERRIAAALDTVGVLFFPNCVARITVGDTRDMLIPDFLICDDGKWGILECDGATYHPSAAKDHDRDRFFRQYKIKVVERYPGMRCMNDAPGVVRDFLTLLKKNG